jgi:hypothetical protein
LKDGFALIQLFGAVRFATLVSFLTEKFEAVMVALLLKRLNPYPELST